MRLVALDAATGRARQRAFCRPSCRPRRGAVRNAHFMRVFAFVSGRGGIRTHEGLAPLAVFKTAALNHSATLPY
jgi:hypothetical protein